MSRAKNLRPKVFQYTDFRKYLSELSVYIKREKPQFSHRYFARLAGYKSSSALKKILSGDLRLSEEAILKVIRIFEIPKSEQEFFSQLVHFHQAQNGSLKVKLAQEIV